MNVFDLLEKNLGNKQCDFYIVDFLSKRNLSESNFIKGSEQEQIKAYEVLNKIPLVKFIDLILEIAIDLRFQAEDIPCFSSFLSGAIRVPEILMFESNGLTFQQLGYQLTGTNRETAQIKYGENHAKLALMMSLVSFSSSRPTTVSVTPLGSFLTKVPYEQKKDFLKKLLLRDRFIQAIIQGALSGKVSYRDLTRCLSDSTAYRRRTNVRTLINFILKDSCPQYLSNINWMV